MDYNIGNNIKKERLKLFLFIWLPVILISTFHYLSPHYLHWTHDILRRMYYIPIIFAGFYKGRNYSIFTAIIITILYIPHAYIELSNFSTDPASSINKTMEIILYFVISYITSTLSDKVKKEKNKYQKIAHELKNKLKEVHLLEEQLIQSAKLEAIGQMSAGFAHEIKNPLASIQATNEFIEEECKENEKITEFIKIQKKELNRLKDLLTQFLNFAKPSPIENIDIDLVNLIENLMKLIKTQKKYGINFENKLSNKDLRIKGDYKKLYQVFLNLILNAIDAIGSNGRIDVVLENKNDEIYVAIKDNGCGISKENLSSIFNPFFTTKDNGTGLGLAIAFKIIEQHKGKIKVNSKENKGSEFIINFPITI
jgi:signal transduction histidine kinase